MIFADNKNNNIVLRNIDKNPIDWKGGLLSLASIVIS